MPVYEYLCEDCVGVFELLRPVREASSAQPCPVCDADARRLMPTDFAAYVQREGLPRRIPDQGKYWTAKGLADKPEDGSGMVEGLGLTYPWARPNPLVIAAGGLAALIAPHCASVDFIEPYLTLYGLEIADRLLDARL